MYVDLKAQSDLPSIPDSVINSSPDTLIILVENDNIDTSFSHPVQPDTGFIKPISPNAIEKIVTYEATDSIIIDIKKRVAYLYKNAIVFYEDMELQADYIEIDFKNNELFASGIADERGHVTGHPVFIQNDGTYRAHEIKYNFTTKKGKISGVITSDGEGYIHGKYVKKLEEYSFIKSGLFTTCELDHPHFEIGFTRAKVIPNDKIITGPAYVSFGGVPTFLAIPFGFFPIEKGRSSGFVPPRNYGQSANRGFYLEDMGFYFGINDNIDLKILGGITTRGSWSLSATSNYVFRYKSKGLIDLRFAQNVFGERFTPSHRRENDFKIKWSHSQDPKFHPTIRFSANIDIVTRSFNRYNPTSINDYVNNQYNSNVNFSTNAKGIFFFSTSLSYIQNTRTGEVDFALPNMNMSVNQFYPFRKKDKPGPLKWYDNISLKWDSEFRNDINTVDSLMFDRQTWEMMNIGMVHRIPLTIPLKIAKLINWNTTANFTERWYLQSITRDIEVMTDTAGKLTGTIYDNFHRGFNALHQLSLSSSLTTKIYFMYQFKKGGLNAIRHIMTPDVRFTYNPNLNGTITGQYFNPITGETVEYSYFDRSSFGAPTQNTEAKIGLSLRNDIEIKVRSRKDTISGTRKISIFEGLTFATDYNFAADSLKWAPLSISGRSTLFQQLYITFRFAFDPYVIGINGKRINQTEWKVNKRLFRFSNSVVDLSLNWTLDRNTFSRKKNNSTSAAANSSIFSTDDGLPSASDPYQNPWSLTFNYSFSYSVKDDEAFYRGESWRRYTNNIINVLNARLDLSITRKWRLELTTGYDFMLKELSITEIKIFRDLHCWEMSFGWIPFGYRKGWEFTINVKAPMLQDLRYNMKRDFRDNLY